MDEDDININMCLVESNEHRDDTTLHEISDNENVVPTIQVNDLNNLSETVRSEFHELIDEYRDLFAFSYDDIMKCQPIFNN